MHKLPKIICSSVIRSSHQGESHGGVYIVDLEKDYSRQVRDWVAESLDWEGRGGDGAKREVEDAGGGGRYKMEELEVPREIEYTQ